MYSIAYWVVQYGPKRARCFPAIFHSDIGHTPWQLQDSIRWDLHLVTC
jgi:hypothetical protein